jgi:hypothetical protein
MPADREQIDRKLRVHAAAPHLRHFHRVDAGSPR